jgi:hypothetical protein
MRVLAWAFLANAVWFGLYSINGAQSGISETVARAMCGIYLMIAGLIFESTR